MLFFPWQSWIQFHVYILRHLLFITLPN
jgi:hypothetical protein